VILAIANTETPGLKEFDAVLSRLDKSRPVNILFRRGEWVQYVVVRPAR
jgi:serine protease Do